MSAIERVLSIPSIKAEHPRLYAEAMKELEELRKAAQLGVQATRKWREAIEDHIAEPVSTALRNFLE
jgi:hypothetical protein